MFCSKCAAVLDLDILFSTYDKDIPSPNDLDDTSYPHHHHHDTFAELVKAAKLGCPLCKLAEAALYREAISKSSLTADMKINFRLRDYWTILEFTASAKGDPKVLQRGRIKLTADKDDPIKRIKPSLFEDRPLAEDSGSDECFELVQYWLKICLDEHLECKYKGPSLMPTRVLDVRAEDDACVNLRNSAGEYGQWLTLSHCWGTVHSPPKTTTANIKERFQAINMGDLPQLFQDAINITRKLGFRYIWIDSLCIIQDSKEDWEQEYIKMAKIYSNAFLNIAADASSDSHQGIFDGVNSGRQQEEFHMPCSPRSRSTLLPVHSKKHNISTTLYANGILVRGGISKLDQRAWVFQETFLSPRRISYGVRGLEWKCLAHPQRQYWVSETMPLQIYRKYKDHIPISVQNLDVKCEPLRDHPGAEVQDDTQREIMDWWYNLVNDYSARQLTYPKDRFPAIAGLAKVMANATGYNYVAGLWMEDIHRALLWTSGGKPQVYENTPSWSWASAQGGFLFGYIGAVNLYTMQHSYWKNAPGPKAEILAVNIDNIGNERFGEIRAASLYLRGYCQSLAGLLDGRDHFFEMPEQRRDAAYDIIDRPSNRDSIILFPDTLDKSLENFWSRRNVIAVQIARFEGFELFFTYEDWAQPNYKLCLCRPEGAFALILEDTGREPLAYRRIGVVKMPVDEKLDQSWDVRTVTII